jgi:hypothetical protein
MKGSTFFIWMIIVFGLLLVGGLIALSAMEEDMKEKYKDCPECLNNTTLFEYCDQFNNTTIIKPPECTHREWCVLFEQFERSTR